MTIYNVITRWSGGKHGYCVLFLPEAEANAGRIVCYAHVGQHSEASMAYFRQTRRCQPDALHEVIARQALLREYAAKMERGEAMQMLFNDRRSYKAARWGWLKEKRVTA